MNEQRLVAAIHDMSGFGRCSLTVILPILSAMGVQVCPIPTAVLATHTGGFGDVKMQDLTRFIPTCLEKYRELGIGFDAVYSGFLASEAQIDHCLDFMHAYPKALKIADPVMGDHGRVYSTYTSQLCERMNELAKAADIITPNLTEAAILLGGEYKPVLTLREAEDMLGRLLDTAPAVVVTGVALTDKTIVNLGGNSSSRWLVHCEYIPVDFPGTGDMFASVLTGGLLRGDNLDIAVSRAAAFTQAAVKETCRQGTPPRNGVAFEPLLNLLINDNIFSKISQL